ADLLPLTDKTDSVSCPSTSSDAYTLCHFILFLALGDTPSGKALVDSTDQDHL
ncbi:hypothetical protein A2U01_0010161, partial [Trifolium medium]|nr:hypothetical protein [Trifolium medium]